MAEAALQLVDFHNHLIPGVDDGAQTIEDSRHALRAFAAAGVTSVITTPHIEASLDEHGQLLAALDVMDARWQELARLAAEEFPHVRVVRGAEVKLDVPEPRLDDPRLRLGGGRFVLIEFPFMTVPPRSEQVLAKLRARGWLPVVAHPERYIGVDERLGVIQDWSSAGAFLQLNGGSLLGRYGEAARAQAQRILHRGLAHYVSSDYHTRGDPLVTRYREWLVRKCGIAVAELLMAVNPLRLLDGDEPLPVPALPARGLWSRISAVLR